MKKKILILGGGISGERSISLKTAKAVKKSIKKKYNCKIVEPDEYLTKNIEKFSPHVVFNACLLYTSPSPRDPKSSRMPSSA